MPIVVFDQGIRNFHLFFNLLFLKNGSVQGDGKRNISLGYPNEADISSVCSS